MHPYLSAIEKHRALILEALDYIWKNPETGYREWKTHAYLKAAYEKLGYTLTEAGNIPGFTAELDTGKEGPTIAVFGEMDSLIGPSHPEADPETKAVPACGHCAQSAALFKNFRERRKKSEADVERKNFSLYNRESFETFSNALAVRRRFRVLISRRSRRIGRNETLDFALDGLRPRRVRRARLPRKTGNRFRRIRPNVGDAPARRKSPRRLSAAGRGRRAELSDARTSD
jgi:hypothetical protein